MWNAAVIIAFLFFLIAGFREGNWLLNAINFSLFMVVAKLFQRRNARDYYQIYALSFLQIIGSAVINPGISFGVIFFIYLVLLTSGLILLTVLRDYEESSAATGGRADRAAIFGRRDIIRPNLLMLASGMAVVVFILSLFIFFAFPRLGLGFFSVKVRKGVNITGFSDRIELGGFGTIKDDPEVVMRVVIRQGAHLAGSALRMRGMALDYYDGRQWLKTFERRRELIFDNDGNMRVDLRVAPLEHEKAIEQEIYLEPLNSDTKVLFAMPVFTAIKRVQSVMDIIKTYRIGFYRDYSNNVTFSGPANLSLSYTAFSYPEERDPGKLRDSDEEYDKFIKKYYLQLPLIDGSVVKLAGEITKGADTPYDKAEKIEKYLSSNFRYSLDSAHPPDDPVKDFLIANREGHCE
ncbi:MAG: DUF3488 domain-containing protein, partial [Deltaproteobacteria bacterium]|nr:DUF3488 domain-containing protein [Deltaproteobacteria bacterium]